MTGGLSLTVNEYVLGVMPTAALPEMSVKTPVLYERKYTLPPESLRKGFFGEIVIVEPEIVT